MSRTFIFIFISLPHFVTASLTPYASIGLSTMQKKQVRINSSSQPFFERASDERNQALQRSQSQEVPSVHTGSFRRTSEDSKK